MLKPLRNLALAAVMTLFSGLAMAADDFDAGRLGPGDSGPAVDGVNFKLSVLGGVFQRNDIGDADTAMFVGSIATPLPFFPDRFGMQLDLGGGTYDDGHNAAAAGLHLFWRDPAVGLFGVYGDWAYVNPEHAGRAGAEIQVYNDRWTLDVFAGIQFGQHVYTRFVDEVDLAYYFTDNLRGSIGHRLTSRGHVANASFEYMFSEEGMQGVSLFGEIEGGEDNYHAAWAGLRYSFGTGSWTTLIDRDRRADPTVRIPRNIASVTQCANIDQPRKSTFFRGTMSNLCASEDEINRKSSTGIVKK